MADQQDQAIDPISESWDRNIKLRNELASRAGKPDNLETGVGDALLGFTGSTLTNTGSTIKNLSLGDVSRAMRATADGSYMQGNVDSAVDMVTGGDIQKTREQGKGLLTDALGLGDVQFVGVDPSKNPVKEAVGNVIGKAASAGTAVADSIDQNIVKPVVEPVGKAIQSGGEGLKNLRSDDAKLADQSKFYTQDKDGNYHFGDAWSDPAKFVTRAVDVFGSLAPTILSGLITKGAVAPMVTKSMLKRGLSAEAAAVIGKATADRVAQNVVLAGGIGMSVGQSKDQAREAVSGLSYEELMSSPTFRENVRLVNEDPNNQTLSSTQRLEFARERTAEQAASYAGSDPTTYAGAVAGTVLGDAYLFKMITGKKEAAQVTGNILARTAKGFFKGGVGEGTGEAIEEGLQKNIANRASNEVGGTNIDPWEGAGLAALEAGTLGVLSGGAVGSVSADIHGSSKPAADTTTNTATPPTGPQTTTPSNVAGEVDVNTAIKEVSEGRKVAGSFSIGKGPEGYRAAYINQGGELRVTQPFATAEEAQQAAIQTTQPLRAEAPQQAAAQPTPDQAMQQTDDLANIPAFMRNGQELSPELEQARSQAINNAWQDQSAQQSAAQAGVLQPRDVQVTGNPDEPAFLRTQQNNPTGRDTSTLQDADPYTQAQAALAKGGAPTADDLIQQSIQNGNQGKTPQEAGLTGDLLLASEPISVPATTEQSSTTIDGQSSEIIPESRGLGYNSQINMPGDPGNGINDNYVPPVTTNRVTADQSLGQESTRDPRSPVAQSIDSAGNQANDIFSQLQTLRVTKRGKPFASQKEALLASRKTETPIELPTGGFGVVNKAELEQVQSNTSKQETTQYSSQNAPASDANSIVNDITVGLPDGTKTTVGEQTASQSSNDQANTPVSNVNDTNVADINQVADPVDVNKSMPNQVVAQNQPDINVNESSNSQANANQPIADQAVGTPSPETVTAPVVAMEGQPTPAPANAEQISEADLKDLDLLKEHAGKWKSRYAVGANWQTASTKESALERARGAHQKAIANGDPLPTKAERYSTSEAAQAAQMEQRYGKISIPELEKEHARLGSVVADLQQTGKNEFNGNGGRRTGAATANEGARGAGLEKMRLESYIKARKERESATGNKENFIANPPEQAASKPGKTIQDHFDDLNKFHRGDLNFDEFKQASSDFLDNEEAVKAKLSSLTKPEILKRMGAMFNYNHKGDKKDVIVDAAYQSLAGQLRFAAHGDKDVITETVSFEEIQGNRARKTTASKARDELSTLTPEQYGIYQEKAKVNTKKAEERFQKVKQQISDPQTLDDFETFLNYRSSDKLTPEQKARYEDLKAERNLDKRDQEAAAAKETKVVPTATGDIVKTKHTKEGHDLFVVKLADRVDRDAYISINAKAKELGGYYSKFRGNGAVPGFQFRSEEQAQEFQQWLSNTGNETSSGIDLKATTDITAEPEVSTEESSKKKQAAKLRDRAASVREKAQAELNAERKANTVKRAREAAYAVARAEADLRFANILDAIANGIEAGEIKYLRNMTAGTQLETLDTVLRRIVRSNKMSQAIRDDLIQKGYLRKGDDAELSWTDSAPIEVITQYAEMPGMDYWANILRDTAKNMQTTAGFKQAGVKIMNQVLMAINAENRMVTISDPDLIEKLKQFSKNHEVRDYLKDTMADYDRLVRMGVTSPVELRAALRELHKVKQSLKTERPKRDPVKQKEEALKMRLLNNRNAFVDFFPTPDEHANDVIARAGIEPGMRVLEPSAGHGALAVAARDAGATVDAVELSNDLRDILTEKGFNLVGSDFMDTEPAGEYDAVVMNPPFSNDMDIDHVKHAYAHLKPGGRLVAIVSSMSGERSNNKNKQFKEWLNGLGATEEMMPEGSFKNSMNPTSVRTKIIELQKPSDSESVKPQPMGSRVTIHTPKGKPVEVQYQLVSAADLVASNEFDGRINKVYPQELQPRDRTKASYQQQVNQIAANPEGSRLAGSPESDRGAPIVRDLVVESGNGRTIGIKQAYKQGTATEYRDYLIKHADEFGFTADDVSVFDDPVLVRQRVSELSPEERLDFVVDSNMDAKMANSATEDAKSDARYLDNGMMDLLNIPEGGDLLAASNERFLSAFATKLGSNSLNNYKDSSGRWNESFRKRVSNAIFAYGYDNDTLLKSATGDTSEAGKNLTSALMNNAASVAELRSMVPETAKAFVNYLAEGIDVMTSAKRNGQSIQEVVNQGDMLSGGVSHYGGAIAEMLSDASRSGKRLTETLNQITGMLNESAKAADQIDLLTGEPTQQVTAEEAINAAEKDFNERKQQEQRVQPSQDLFGANSARIGDNNGSGTSVSRPVSASETKSAGENSRLNIADSIKDGMNAGDLVSWIANNSENESYREIAKRILSHIPNDIDVMVVSAGSKLRKAIPSSMNISNGMYWTKGDEKTLILKDHSFGENGLNEETALHELIHAATSAAIKKGNLVRATTETPELSAAVADLYALQKAVVKYLNDTKADIGITKALAASDVKELVAWGMTNKDFQNILQDIPYDKESAWNKFVSLVAKLLGIKQTDKTALGELIRVTDNILSAKESGTVNTLSPDKGKAAQFSKMPLNAAEKSGKGMTKPEATLAAKEWLKQFKTDINVRVVKDQAEFEKALAYLGQPDALQEGEVANAAYLPESNTILINAAAVQNPTRLRQILRHEVLAHYGLEKVAGKEAYQKVMDALRQGAETSLAIKAAFDKVTENYQGADVDELLREVFAHYAENRPVDGGAVSRLWQRVVNLVKAALQKVGFIRQSEAETALDDVLNAIAEQMRNGTTNNDPDGSLGKKTYFSRTMTADDELMTKLGLGPKPGLSEKTKAQLDTLRQSDMNTVKSWITRMKRKSNTEILDALAPIKYAEDSAGKLDASDSGYVAARMAAGSSSVMQATMLYGIPEWKDGVIQRKAGTNEKDSMLGIFEGLGSDLHNWLGWMAGHRAEILMKEGRENLLTNDDIAALKAKGIGKEAAFMAAKEKWNKLNGAMLDMAQEAGLFTAEDRAKFESEWYVPFFREAEDGDVMGPFKKNGIANQSAGIKQLKGGTANVNDILENIFQTTSKLIDSSMKNMAAQKVVHNLAETDLISIIDKPNLIDIKAAAQNKQNMMMVKVDGESHVVQVNDPALFKAMTMIDSVIERDPFTKAAMKAKHLITAGVTSGPEFMLRNFLRDSASTWAINEDGFKPMIDSIRGVKKAWKMDDSSINMMFSGASFMGGNLRGTDPEAMASVIRKTLRRKGMSPEKINEYENSLITTGRKAKDVLLHSWEQYERFGEAVENGSREAVYEAAIKAGKSHAQAAFEARDLMDFSMRGSSKIMRWLVDVLPFFNARMQGLGKLGRAMAANPKQIARRGGMIAAASLALLALNWDDDRYNDLPDWDKDMNWHFWLGDQHFRIPKPFEIGLMFGTLPERMVRTMGGKDTAGKFGKVVARNMLETFAINPIPQVVKPLTEAYFNYDPFRGGPIENMSDMNVNPEARYDERTSLMMRELGELTGMSPKKLEYVISGYTGTMGGYVMAMGDWLVRMMGDYGDSPALRADQIPILKSVYQGSAPAKSTQAMQDFYQMVDEANQVYATIRQYQKEGRMGDAREMLEENRNKLAGRKTMTNAQKQFRQIRNEMDLIQRDRNLNSDQKRERIDRLLSKRNNFAAKLIKRFGTEL